MRETVNFFHRKLPVYGEARKISLPDGDCRFWRVVATLPNGKKGGAFFRVMEGRTLQERLDWYIRHDSAVSAGYQMIWADHVVPASEEEIEAWWRSHQWVYRRST